MLLRLLRWLRAQAAARATQALLRVLAAGPVPRHIAFVMDGNRRYARRAQKPVAQGHADGFAALHRMLDVCLRLDIRCVTAYAFSLENFKRSQEEIDALMALAEAKLDELCSHGDLLEKHGVRLNVLGRTELLPPSVQAAARRAEALTAHNDRAILNLCMPYTSRDEITTAVEAAVRDSLASTPPSPVTVEAIDAQLMTSRARSPPLDVLVRTSGVTRLSDFLLWQCCEDTQLQFSATYWPDFGLWDFVPIILDYQRKVWARQAQGGVYSGDAEVEKHI